MAMELHVYTINIGVYNVDTINEGVINLTNRKGG